MQIRSQNNLDDFFTWNQAFWTNFLSSRAPPSTGRARSFPTITVGDRSKERLRINLVYGRHNFTTPQLGQERGMVFRASTPSHHVRCKKGTSYLVETPRANNGTNSREEKADTYVYKAICSSQTRTDAPVGTIDE